MTVNEWNHVIKYLGNAECGDWVQNEKRMVEVVDMCGGKYLLLDDEGEVAGLTDETWRAACFLENGKVLS